MSDRHEVRPFKVEFNSDEEYKEFINWAEGKKKSKSSKTQKLFKEYKAMKMKKAFIEDKSERMI
ncbi:hypothetical protein AAXE64_07465 [Priestia megaterium]